jgi:hypothetical protein
VGVNQIRYLKPFPPPPRIKYGAGSNLLPRGEEGLFVQTPIKKVLLLKLDDPVKSPKTVIPAKAGIQNLLKILDERYASFHVRIGPAPYPIRGPV